MQTIRIKSGVCIAEINQPFMQFCKALDDVCLPLRVTPVITSAAEGEHMDGSFHGAGYGWDVRTRNLIVPQNVAIGLKQILAAVDKHFRVIYGDPKHLDHIHVEYDFKPEY